MYLLKLLIAVNDYQKIRVRTPKTFFRLKFRKQYRYF